MTALTGPPVVFGAGANAPRPGVLSLPNSRLLDRTGVLHRHVHQALLSAGADNPLRGHFQSDVARYPALARLVSDALRGVRDQVESVALQRLHKDIEFRCALLRYRLRRAG